VEEVGDGKALPGGVEGKRIGKGEHPTFSGGYSRSWLAAFSLELKKVMPTTVEGKGVSLAGILKGEMAVLEVRNASNYI